MCRSCPPSPQLRGCTLPPSEPSNGTQPTPGTATRMRSSARALPPATPCAITVQKQPPKMRTRQGRALAPTEWSTRAAEKKDESGDTGAQRFPPHHERAQTLCAGTKQPTSPPPSSEHTGCSMNARRQTTKASTAPHNPMSAHGALRVHGSEATPTKHNRQDAGLLTVQARQKQATDHLCPPPSSQVGRKCTDLNGRDALSLRAASRT